MTSGARVWTMTRPTSFRSNRLWLPGFVARLEESMTLFDRDDLALHVLRSQADIVDVPDLHRLAGDPEQVGMKPVGLDRRLGLMGGDITAFDENLFGQSDPDRITGDRFGAIASAGPAFDRLDDRSLVCRGKNQLVPYPQLSGLDPAGNDPALIETVDILNAESKGKIVLGRLAAAASSASRTVGPLDQTIFSLRSAMLSPVRAETGTKQRAFNLRSDRNFCTRF